MKTETMKAAVEILAAQGEEVDLQYPGSITLARAGRIFVFGDANADFGGDVYASLDALEQGKAPDLITTPLSSEHDNPADVAQAITSAVDAYQQAQPPRFYVLNETDGILAHPDAMTREECDAFMVAFRQRFAAQGYYASAAGRIPASELRFKRIPEGDL
jgi:hypothetical protein